MTNITRNRDLYEVDCDGKKMRISLKPDNMYVIGFSKKLLKNPSTRFSGKDMPHILSCMALGIYIHQAKEIREYADRLISLPNYSFEIKNFAFKAITDSLYNDLKVDWKYYVNALKDIYSDESTRAFFENNASLLDPYAGFESFDTLYKKSKFKLGNYYSEEVVDKIKEAMILNTSISNSFIDYTCQFKAFREGVKGIYKRIKESEEMLKKCRNLLSNLCGGIDYDEASELTNIVIITSGSDFNFNNKVGTLVRKCRDCVNLKEKLGIDYKFTNFDRDYNTLTEMYNKQQWERDNVRFSSHQTGEPLLAFETEKYKTFIPTTRQELNEIGQYFNNCANGYEWDTRLCCRKYYLVTVISKESNNPVACVDIYKYDKTIGQFLGKNNTYIQNPALLAFREAFQKHLQGE